MPGTTRRTTARDSGRRTGTRKVAVACQGGGSHTAFTAGVLHRLLGESGLEIRALSGTSGGAVCAVLAWSELVAAAREPDPGRRNHRLAEFWDETAMPVWQVAPWSAVFAGIRLMGQLGLALETSPYHVPVDGHRMFLDLLERHVPFPRLGPEHLTDADPRLLISAADVCTGEFRVFRSHALGGAPADPIESRTVLASAAQPNLYRAVELDGGTYWDGLASQNPPCRELVEAARRPAAPDDEPEEIELWVVQINPQRRDAAPTSIDGIRDRQNELVGNISYQQEIYFISKINEFVRDGAFTAEARRRYGQVRVRGITMDEAMSTRLDYESKLDRNPALLHTLFRHGRERADEFLAALDRPDADELTTLPDHDVWGTWTGSRRPVLSGAGGRS